MELSTTHNNTNASMGMVWNTTRYRASTMGSDLRRMKTKSPKIKSTEWNNNHNNSHNNVGADHVARVRVVRTSAAKEDGKVSVSIHVVLNIVSNANHMSKTTMMKSLVFITKKMKPQQLQLPNSSPESKDEEHRNQIHSTYKLILGTKFLFGMIWR